MKCKRKASMMKRSLRRAIYVCLPVICCYMLVRETRLQLLSAPTASPIFPSMLTMNSFRDAHARRNNTDLTPLPDDFTFVEEDMVDEYGDAYTIVIWSEGHVGTGSYRARPDVCYANVSCDVIHARWTEESAHAIVFGRHVPPPVEEVAAHRQSWQLFVWWEEESPARSFGPPDLHDYFYNLTFHHRLDADVYAPYGSIHLVLRQLQLAGETDINALMDRKRAANKTAVWVTSNCQRPRMELAQALVDAGLEVDRFGACFHDYRIADQTSDRFYADIGKYKFYFAFENSLHCRDYITEKFWFNGLRAGAVPVVWGPRKADVLKVAPARSFVHAEDFAYAKDLAEYLQRLARNEVEYVEYLRWREWVKRPDLVEPRLRKENRHKDLRSFCRLCAILQADGRRRKRGFTPPVRRVKSARQLWREPECH